MSDQRNHDWIFVALIFVATVSLLGIAWLNRVHP